MARHVRKDLGLALVLGGCGDPEEDGAAATAAAVDSEFIAQVTLETAESIADLSEDVTLAEGSVAGVGDCMWSYRVEGSPTEGFLSIDPAAVPCGGTYTGDYGSVVFDVTAGGFAGTYTSEDGVITVDIAGSRDATLTLVGSAARPFDSSYTAGVSASVTAEGILEEWSGTLAYMGFGALGRTLEVSGDGESVTGTLTGPAGSCTVTGTATTITVDCA